MVSSQSASYLTQLLTPSSLKYFLYFQNIIFFSSYRFLFISVISQCVPGISPWTSSLCLSPISCQFHLYANNSQISSLGLSPQHQHHPFAYLTDNSSVTAQICSPLLKLFPISVNGRLIIFSGQKYQSSVTSCSLSQATSCLSVNGVLCPQNLSNNLTTSYQCYHSHPGQTTIRSHLDNFSSLLTGFPATALALLQFLYNTAASENDM